jgi:hypothetical protein
MLLNFNRAGKTPMTDVPFVISAAFSKTVQTAPYESEKAEISAQCQISEGADAGAAIEGTMAMVKRQVLIALGKAEGELKAVSTDPQKRGPGRPKKEVVEEPKQAIPSKETEKAAAVKEPEAEDEDFGDDAQDAPVITDKALQDACGLAAKKPGMDAGKVKRLFQTNFGAARVSLVAAADRPKFLAELEKMVEDNKPKGE